MLKGMFDIETYRNTLLEKENDSIEKYERYYGTITDDVDNLFFVKQYTCKFEMPESWKFNVPEELADDFDYPFLLQLTVASFSSELELVFNNGIVDIQITVESGGQNVQKTLEQLWGFQILRLYEIYIAEQINLSILIKEDENKKRAIEKEQCFQLEKFNLLKNKINAEYILWKIKSGIIL